MYLEAKETARLYKLLSDKLGSDTTEAMFKYIDNKTERSVEVTIKTLATKDDLRLVRDEIAIEGKLASRSYVDKDGNKRYVTEVVVNEFLKVGLKK